MPPSVHGRPREPPIKETVAIKPFTRISHFNLCFSGYMTHVQQRNTDHDNGGCYESHKDFRNGYDCNRYKDECDPRKVKPKVCHFMPPIAKVLSGYFDQEKTNHESFEFKWRKGVHVRESRIYWRNPWFFC